MLKFDVRNIIVVLFFVIFGYVTGAYNGFLWGRKTINHWLVVSSYNAGYTSGEVRGSSRVFHLLFEDYLKANPYSLDCKEDHDHE